MRIPTVHNSAKYGDIAETILLPGDPLRAKFIAENFLTDAVMYSKIRGMLGYTGLYKGERVSVQGTGMGGPSMGIYAHELIHAYGVKRLIRVGSAGAIQNYLKIGDLIGVTAACYDTNFSTQWEVPGTIVPAGSFRLLQAAHKKATECTQKIHIGTVLSADLFYNPGGVESLIPWKKAGVLAVEMEAASLYMTAQSAQVDAVCLLTVSDLPFTGEEMSSKEREQSLLTMIELGLDIASDKNY